MKTCLCGFLWLFSAQAFSAPEVKFVSDFGFVVENQITTRKSAEQVRNALIHHIDEWWPKDHSWWGAQGKFYIEPRAGGCFCEISDDKSAEHMHIAFVEPQTLLRMTGGLGPLQGMGMYGALDWRFEQHDKLTKVVLTYTVNGAHPDGFASLAPIVAQVQGQQLMGLKTFVESR